MNKGIKNNSGQNKFLGWINGWDAYFIAVTLLYLLWRARVFFERCVYP
ncbi:MAG TPA: hypothetical protein PL155_05425 [Candidatus Omnitrophota bacterium]|nr:hypothetical protein [Candidatus Omnitrophota bacterium]HPD84078.1 hypothetical protein [Candidatus Omnitrophota bacterium]HRZ02935.1 hypothetical protein [Candidatus Omnitrophota bacterium]